MLMSTTGASSSMSDTVGDSILGSPHKALLILFTGSQKRLLKNSDIANIASSALATSVNGMMEAAASSIDEYNSNPALAKSLSKYSVEKLHFLEVQYNPNSIDIQANAEDVPIRGLQQHLDNGIPNSMMRPPSVTLSVDLLFDAVNLSDSFMWEKFTLGLSGQTISNAATLVSQAKGNVWSVQKQTNGLLGAIMNKNTRFMIFKWADMTFAGELSEVSATYNMFSISGRPVRSTVTLRITQNVQSKDNITYWDNAVDDATFSSTEFKQMGQTAASKLDHLQNLLSFTF